MPGELSHRDLDADAGEEPDEHGAGHEVREEAEPGEPARNSRPPAMSALRLARASHWDVPGWSPAIRAGDAGEQIAAVAESPPTTRCRDDPKTANARIGRRIVYSPVITGVPAIFV